MREAATVQSAARKPQCCLCRQRARKLAASNPAAYAIEAKTKHTAKAVCFVWSGRRDLNSRPAKAPVALWLSGALRSDGAERRRTSVEQRSTPRPGQEKKTHRQGGVFSVVGAERFELSTSCTPSKRATQAALRPDFLLLRFWGTAPKRYRVGFKRQAGALLPVLATTLMPRLAYWARNASTKPPSCASFSGGCTPGLLNLPWATSVATEVAA